MKMILGLNKHTLYGALLSISVSSPSIAFATADETCQIILHAPNRAYVGKVKVSAGTDDNSYETNRGLDIYGDLTWDHRNLLGGRRERRAKGLAPIIESLPADSVWIDMGSGAGRALKEGLELNPNIWGIGIAYKEPEAGFDDFSEATRIAKEALVKEGRLEFFYDELIEKLDESGKLDSLKNKTSLITDFIGPLSYTYDFPLVMQIYVDLLEQGGTLLFTQPPILLKGADGRNIELLDWLKTISGISAEKTDGRGLRITKTKKSADIPQDLFLTEEGVGLPPKRVYQSK